MPSLKDLKSRIGSVKKTQKITKAMQMVAASKLRRARESAEAARPYSDRMERMVMSLAGNVKDNPNAPKLLTGTGAEDVHLLIPIMSDRGLCGAFNSSIYKATRQRIAALQGEGKTVKLFCVGKKSKELLSHLYPDLIVELRESRAKHPNFEEGEDLAQTILLLFEAGEFDVCTLVFNTFRSAISQVITFQQLIPLPIEVEETDTGGEALLRPVYDYEPPEEELLARLLPRNLAVQCYRGLLESTASELGARMTAMDNATRNAGDMIDSLSLTYNRTRQAQITKELIEIISGAEAL